MTAKKHSRVLATAWPIRRSRRIIQQKHFRFFDLSPEIRNIIYTLVLQRAKPIYMRGYKKKKHSQLRSLTQASRATRQESLGLFYSLNTFQFYIYEDVQTKFPAWLRSLDDPAVASIRRFIVSHYFTMCEQHGQVHSSNKAEISITGTGINVRYEPWRNWSPNPCLSPSNKEAITTVAEALLWQDGKPCVTIARLADFLKLFACDCVTLAVLNNLTPELIKKKMARI